MDLNLDLGYLATSHLLSVAARALSARTAAPLHMLGLPPVGLYALESLAHQGPLRQSELARLLYVRPQTAGHLLSRLERRGLISRRHSGQRNHITVTITNEGRTVLARAQALLPAETFSTLSSPVAPSSTSATPAIPAISGELIINARDNDYTTELRGALEALRPLLQTIITNLDADHRDPQ